MVTVAGQETAKLRSLPAWSPDGSQLVWNEADTDGSNLETVVYDFAAQTGTVVYQREEPSAAFLVAGVQWGQPGLALYDVVRGADDRMQAAVTLIDPAGEDVRQIAVEMADNVVGLWAVDRFVLGAVDNELTVINPASGAVESMVGRLEYYSLSAPDSSIGLTQITAAGEWVVFGPDFNGGLGVNESQYSLTISPDGQKLAIVTFENYPFGGKAYILDQFDGFPYTGTPVSGMDSAGYSQPGALYVFWGPVGLRIQES